MNVLTSALEKEADALFPELESIYKDLHRNPELSMVEMRTAEMRQLSWSKKATTYRARSGPRVWWVS